MVANDNDKDSCVCCSEPKPGSKPKKSEESTKDLGGSITSAGFKFGVSGTTSSSTDNGSGFKFGEVSGSAQSDTATGFKFGSSTSETTTKAEDTTTKVSQKKEYSQEYLSHLKALNVQVSQWIKTHIEKNPYVFLTPVFKDYEKHLKDLEEKSDSEVSSKSTSDKPLLGGVFGASSSEKSAEPVKFGSGSAGFAFGSSNKPAPASTAFSFGSSSSNSTESTKTGFSFGAAASKPEEEKSASDKPSGFSFGSKPEDNSAKVSTGFTFGSTKPEVTKSSGFSFGGSGTSQPTGFSFGSNTLSNSTGFSFGSGPTTVSDNKTTGDNDEEESDEPPKVEVKEVAEDDAYHSVR